MPPSRGRWQPERAQKASDAVDGRSLLGANQLNLFVTLTPSVSLRLDSFLSEEAFNRSPPHCVLTAKRNKSISLLQWEKVNFISCVFVLR